MEKRDNTKVWEAEQEIVPLWVGEREWDQSLLSPTCPANFYREECAKKDTVCHQSTRVALRNSNDYFNSKTSLLVCTL